MKKKIIGFIICPLLIAIIILPVVGTVNNNYINNKNIIQNQHQVESEPQFGATNVEDEWPMYLHDPQNTAYSTSSAPQTNTIKWIYTAGNEISSSPAVAYGKVYISTFDNNFSCLDAGTGEELWSYFDYGFTRCSPAVYEGKVYVDSNYDYFYCFDAYTGKVIWKFYKGYRFSASSPAVFGGRVYFAHSRGGSSGQNAALYCLDAGTGDKFWDYDMGYFMVSSPAVSYGKVYIGSEDKKMYCFNAGNGNLLWNFSTGWYVFDSSPTVFDGKIYFGSDALYCLNAYNGSKLWNYTTGDHIYPSPAIAYGNVYYTGYSTGVHCVDVDNGSKIWNYPTGNACSSSPAIADGKIYVGIWETGKLLCLNASTGEKLWEYKTNPKQGMGNSPAVAYGRVYIGGGTTNNVYCFEDPFLPSPSIKGPTGGLINVGYGFQVMAIDPEGDIVKYCVDWDDGTTSGWIGPHPSGEWITVNHSWNKTGTYSIRARGEYANGIRSNWSEPHNMTVIDGPLLEIQSINGGLFKINIVIKNLGTKEAADVNWSVTLDGGFILLGRETTGTGNIPVDGEITVISKPIVGFGSAVVAVNAIVPIGFSDIREQKAFVVLFFILVKPGG